MNCHTRAEKETMKAVNDELDFLSGKEAFVDCQELHPTAEDMGPCPSSVPLQLNLWAEFRFDKTLLCCLEIPELSCF